MSKVIKKFALLFTLVAISLVYLPQSSQSAPSGKNLQHLKPGHSKKYSASRPRDVKTVAVAYLYGNHECPISKEPVVPESYVDYKNEKDSAYSRIYLCGDNCKEKTEEKVAEIYKALYLTDKETGKEKKPVDLNNENCPVMEGMAADPKVFAEYNGMIVYFHCPECMAAFLADPEPGMKRLLGDKKEFEYKRPSSSHN